MVHRGEQLQLEDDLSDLKAHSVSHGTGKSVGPAVHRHAVYPGFAAAAGIQEQADSVLPAEIQVNRPDSGTGHHQVAGTNRAEHTFPGDREPGLRGQVFAAGQDYQFPDGSGSGQAAEHLLPGTPV